MTTRTKYDHRSEKSIAVAITALLIEVNLRKWLLNSYTQAHIRLVVRLRKHIYKIFENSTKKQLKCFKEAASSQISKQDHLK